MKTFRWCCAASGAAVPGISFFTSYPPPLFPGIGLITAALATAIIAIIAATRSGKEARACGPKTAKQAKKMLIAAVVLMVGYIVLFQFTTVKVPIPPDASAAEAFEERLQLGFGRAPWSLTTAGRQWIENHPNITREKMLKGEAGFRQDAVELLWQTWSVIAAGVFLILLFFLSFSLWTTAFSLLANVTPKVSQPSLPRVSSTHC